MAREGKDALRRAKSAESAMRRGVRSDRAATNAHIGALVGSRGVDCSSRQYYWRERFVSAAVDGEINLHRQEFAFARHCGAMPRQGRVALGGCHHVLRAVIDDLHGLARFPGQQRGMTSNHGWIFFLAAEAAAGFRLHYADLFFWQAK